MPFVRIRWVRCRGNADISLNAGPTAATDGCTIFVFYALLHRIALIPRVLAGAGLVAASLQVTSVAMPLFGHDVVFPMLAPLGLIQLILAVWLIWRAINLSCVRMMGYTEVTA